MLIQRESAYSPGSCTILCRFHLPIDISQTFLGESSQSTSSTPADSGMFYLPDDVEIVLFWTYVAYVYVTLMSFVLRLILRGG